MKHTVIKIRKTNAIKHGIGHKNRQRNRVQMKNITLSIPGETNYYMQEAYKTLRTNILFCGSDIKTIGLTSCADNEGKSVITIGIAKSFAELGRKTLILDADMRKSVMAGRNSDAEKPIGLSEVLTGMASFEEAVCSTQQENLDVLFAGKYPPNPVELLNSKNFSALLDELRQVYAQIFIDTAPLGRVIDASVVANKCDGMVLVIGNPKIHNRELQNTVVQLKKSDTPILGVVRNFVSDDGKAYYKKYDKYKAYRA